MQFIKLNFLYSQLNILKNRSVKLNPEILYIYISFFFHFSVILTYFSLILLFCYFILLLTQGVENYFFLEQLFF